MTTRLGKTRHNLKTKEISVLTRKCTSQTSVVLDTLPRNVNVHQRFGDRFAVVDHFQLCYVGPSLLFWVGKWFMNIFLLLRILYTVKWHKVCQSETGRNTFWTTNLSHIFNQENLCFSACSPTLYPRVQIKAFTHSFVIPSHSMVKIFSLTISKRKLGYINGLQCANRHSADQVCNEYLFYCLSHFCSFATLSRDHSLYHVKQLPW